MNKIDREKEAIDFIRANKRDIDIYKVNKLAEKFGVSIYKIRHIIDCVKAE
jgi:DNA-binding MurR/RpiR family transcriptional regulator